MNNHQHVNFRGHIAGDSFDPGIRQSWRESARYWEALRAHHTYSNDREMLIATMTALISRQESLQRAERIRILDIGCGDGEVAGRILGSLGTRSDIDYVGLDKSEAILSLTENRIRQRSGGNPSILLLSRDFGSQDWNTWPSGEHSSFDMIWLLHSGYYLESGHGRLLADLGSLLHGKGMIVLMHNPEGNEPFRIAAHEQGLEFFSVPYAREIRMPAVTPEVFDILSRNPESFDDFDLSHGRVPGARAMRLLLEFYLPDYPLDALSENDRSRYIENWRRHLLACDGCFRNDHEMLVITNPALP